MARPILRWWERVRSHHAALTDLARRRTAVWDLLVPLAPARLGARGRSRGRILGSVVDDLEDVVSAQVRVTVPIVAMAVAGLVAAAVAAWVDVTAGLVAVATDVVLAIVGWLHARLEARSQRAIVTARAEVTTVAALVATNATPLAAVGGQAWVVARLATAQAKLRRAGMCGPDPRDRDASARGHGPDGPHRHGRTGRKCRTARHRRAARSTRTDHAAGRTATVVTTVARLARRTRSQDPVAGKGPPDGSLR